MKKLTSTNGFVLTLVIVGMVACTVRDVTEDPQCCKPQQTAVAGKGGGGAGAIPDSSSLRSTETSSTISSNGGTVGSTSLTSGFAGEGATAAVEIGVPAAAGGTMMDSGVAPMATGGANSSGAASTVVVPTEAGGTSGAGGSSATSPSAVAGTGYCTLGVSRLGACLLK